MNSQKKQALKRFTYLCLSLSSITFSSDIQALNRIGEENFIWEKYSRQLPWEHKKPQGQSGSASGFRQASERHADTIRKKAIVTQDSEALRNADGGFLGIALSPTKQKFHIKRIQQEEFGDNILEIQNDNSKPLAITLLDQNSSFFTELGIVEARSTIRFSLDRTALPDHYSVKGYIGFSRDDTCANLSFRKFYSKVRFQKNTVGTTAHLERMADVY